MRDYEHLITESQKAIEQLVHELPSAMQAPLTRQHALEDVEHMQKTLGNREFQSAYDPYRKDVKVRANLFVLSELMQDIEAVRESIAQIGGVETFDKMRSQIIAILNAPPKGKF